MALFESGFDSPGHVVGSSVGALNGAGIAAFPTLAGAQMVRQFWQGEHVRQVFRRRPAGMLLSRLQGRASLVPSTSIERLIIRVEELTGCRQFEDLRIPLSVLATDLGSGLRVVFRSGPLGPALLASTAIPGLYPAVTIGPNTYLDGGVVDNTPISVAVEEGAREILAISLMAGAELEAIPRSWGGMIARTLQLSLHHRMLSDFERLRERARIAVLCPVLSADADQAVTQGQAEGLIESARVATRAFLARTGGSLFRHSAVHYLDLR
jgi:NTE family protein